MNCLKQVIIRYMWSRSAKPCLLIKVKQPENAILTERRSNYFNLIWLCLGQEYCFCIINGLNKRAMGTDPMVCKLGDVSL